MALGKKQRQLFDIGLGNFDLQCCGPFFVVLQLNEPSNCAFVFCDVCWMCFSTLAVAHIPDQVLVPFSHPNGCVSHPLQKQF